MSLLFNLPSSSYRKCLKPMLNPGPVAEGSWEGLGQEFILQTHRVVAWWNRKHAGFESDACKSECGLNTGSCVTSSEFPNLSELPFYHLWNRDNLGYCRDNSHGVTGMVGFQYRNHECWDKWVYPPFSFFYQKFFVPFTFCSESIYPVSFLLGMEKKTVTVTCV